MKGGKGIYSHLSIEKRLRCGYFAMVLYSTNGRIGIKTFDVLSSGKTRRHGKLAERVIALVPCSDVHDVGVYSSASLSSASDNMDADCPLTKVAQTCFDHLESMCLVQCFILVVMLT